MDDACLEKLATLLIGVSVAGAAAGTGVLAGLTEVGTGAAGLWLRLTGQRRRDADAVLGKLTQTIGQEWQAWGQTASFADDRLRASVVASFETVIPRCTIPAAAVVAVRLNADAVAGLVLAQAEVALPGVYADRNPRNVEAHHARMFLRDVTRRAYAALLAESGYIDTIAPDLWSGVLDGIGRIEDTTGRIDATTQETAEQLRHLTGMVAHLTRATAARASGITGDALIGLARRIAADVADPAAAFRELENAVEVAIRVQAEGRQGSNLGDFVDEVLRRVAALAAQNQYDTAAREIDAALAQEQAESTARRIRLLAAGIAQDILRRDAGAVARRLVEKARLELAADQTVYANVRLIFIEWFQRGKDKGLNFDLAVAIELCRQMDSGASTQDQRGAALTNLGYALATLGEREAGTARLEQAVAAYRAALTERTQDRVPLDWAMTQNNLGNALRTLGEREAGTERLEQAVEAYHAALTERRQDRVPLGWAATQMNLGNALWTLGEREAGTERLEEAVEAYRAALTERTQDRVPLDWAMTQNNLGNALWTLGEREAGTERLEQAVAAYRAALTERTQARVPLDWAATQMNLGNALATLGEREAGTERLEQAVAAYRAALTERTQDRVPLDWARTLGNEGVALLTLADRTGDLGRARQALEQLTLAEATLRSGGHIPWAETFASQIPVAQALVDRLSAGSP